MRTRRSNRTKRYTVEKYDFESSGDEAVAQPPSRVDRDADFDHEAEDEEDEAEDKADPAVDEDDDDDADGSDAGTAPAQTPRVKPVASRAAKRTKTQQQQPPSTTTPDYRPLEPVPSDCHTVQSYAGPYSRVLRGQSLIAIWYGPRSQDMHVCQRLLDRWVYHPVLPPKSRAADDGAVWIPAEALEREVVRAEEWRARCRDGLGKRLARVLSEDEAAPYRFPDRVLTVLMGPFPNQRVYGFRPGDAHCLAQDGTPFDEKHDEDDGRVPIGWMLDAGGLVVGMDWAPCRGREQRLALAIVPHSDEDMYDYEAEHTKPDFQRHGVVQLWAFASEGLDGAIRPSTRRPRLLRTLCFDYGRARRVKWSPICGHLAVLCADGRVCVVDVDEMDESEGAYERIEAPLATLRLMDEEGVTATSMAWAAYNRLVIGYSDGSVCLWSVLPTYLLGRHPLHHSHVVDLATGYPTMPYLVASSPLGGPTRLVDLRSPSCETTMVQVSAVHWQPNLLAWSDHLLGFLSASPSANALSTTIGFMYHRHFPLVRRLFTGECLLSCLAVGRTHPYLLIGASDGSLWSLNPQCDLFKSRRPVQERIRVFQHEYRPVELVPPGLAASDRGASGVVHGFEIEKNTPSTAEAKTPVPAKKVKRSRKSRKKTEGDGENADEDDDEAMDEAEGGEEPLALTDPKRGILHEPLTRITTVEWNPNPGYGCWAAAAMGSGLVRVLDLGLEVDDDAGRTDDHASAAEGT
ncbi:hypothetical protein CDD80_3401 [Ophiocordyceps camponoti-rufipedis]|uniref:Uncharacterized protein n=1 Tax=Ophiocordyceps camponoti-rufipedis TaxID=2004952 RepID=A0A2C5XIW5_9HYPO|nr:hypothetical protein CDD80_3401 [Ophiocordyceps camponoti-rufipedis]